MCIKTTFSFSCNRILNLSTILILKSRLLNMERIFLIDLLRNSVGPLNQHMLCLQKYKLQNRIVLSDSKQQTVFQGLLQPFSLFSSHHSIKNQQMCINIFGDKKFILLVIRISKIQIRKLQSRLLPKQHLIQKNRPQSNAPKKRLIRVLQLLKQLTSPVRKYCEDGTLHLSYSLKSTFYHINIFIIIVQSCRNLKL